MHALKQNVNPDNNDTPHVTWAQQRHTSRHLVALCFLLSFESNYLQAALQPPIPGVSPSAPQYRHHRGPFFPCLDELRVLAALVKQVDECLRMIQHCSSTSTFGPFAGLYRPRATDKQTFRRRPRPARARCRARMQRLKLRQLRISGSWHCSRDEEVKRAANLHTTSMRHLTHDKSSSMCN